MFTGIIEAVGKVVAQQPRGGDLRLHIATGKLELADVKPGDSIAVSGVCSAGFNTQQHPAASAGPNFHAAMRSG